MRKVGGILTGMLILAIPLGCGSSTGLNLASVRGTVKYKGKPVQNGTIVFEPDKSKNTSGPPGTSPIDKDGAFVLSTSSGGDGAIVGFHKVGIVGLELDPISQTGSGATPESDSGAYLKGKAKAAQQSNKRAVSKVDTFTDRAGRTFKYVIPKKFGNPEDSGITIEVRGGSNSFDFDLKEDGSLGVNK